MKGNPWFIMISIAISVTGLSMALSTIRNRRRYSMLLGRATLFSWFWAMWLVLHVAWLVFSLLR